MATGSTTGSRPEGTITSLPTKEGKGAPDEFTGSSREIETFLDHFEALCAEKNVQKGEYKCRGLVRYCDAKTRETLQSLKAYTDMNYDELKKEIIEYYDQDLQKQRYKLRHLRELAKKWQKRKIEDIGMFKKYQIQYLRIGGWLLKNGKIVEAEHRRWFWTGLHQKFRQRVETQMWIMDPNLDDSVPFAIEKIVAATKRIYNRERFDEEGLVWHAGEKRTRKYKSSDEGSESSEESSGGESAGESSDDDSDQETEKRWRKKREALKKKQAKERKKSVSKSVKRDESGKEERDLEEEIGELVSKMSRMDIQDVAYLAKWVKLVWRAPELQDSNFVRKPASYGTVLRLDSGPRSRDGPPPMNPNFINYNGPTRGFENRKGPRGPGMRCFGCGQLGHPASRCEEINKFIRDGLVIRNEMGRVQWKDGSRISRMEDECIIDAIRRNAKSANLVMIAQRELQDETKYAYLQVERVTSDEESEGQEDMWLEGAPLDVFKAETYNVHRTAGVSRGIRGAERNRIPMKPNGLNNGTRRGNLVKGGLRKDAVDPDFGRNMSNVGDRVEAKVPFDVKEDVFDLKNDDDLIPMVVDTSSTQCQGHSAT